LNFPESRVSYTLMLDDLTLLQWFVSGDATLEANGNLRIQPTNKLRQLFSRRGALVGTAYDAALPPQIVVQRDTDYTAVLHQVLLDHHYVPVGQAVNSLGITYKYHPVPDGYQIHYTPARDLWKTWWRLPYQHAHKHLQLELFALTQDKWYPIRDITLNRGTLYVETLRGETIHGGDDLMVWLQKDSDDEAEKTQFWAASPPLGSVPDQPNAADTTAPVMKPQPTPTPARSQPRVLKPVPSPTAQSAQPLVKSAATVDASLNAVVRAAHNRLYIRTSLGTVVVEGDNLKAYGKVPSYSKS